MNFFEQLYTKCGVAICEYKKENNLKEGKCSDEGENMAGRLKSKKKGEKP